MKIHDFLRFVREKKGFSQEYMAFQLNVSQNCYHKIESGKVSMKVETLLSAAVILEIPVTDFFSNDNSHDSGAVLSAVQMNSLKGGGEKKYNISEYCALFRNFTSSL